MLCCRLCSGLCLTGSTRTSRVACLLLHAQALHVPALLLGKSGMQWAGSIRHHPKCCEAGCLQCRQSPKRQSDVTQQRAAIRICMKGTSPLALVQIYLAVSGLSS